MKSNFLLVLLALCFSTTAFAQTVTYGPRVGANLATQKVSGSGWAEDAYNSNVKYNTGLQAGAVLNYKFSDLFSIQPELLYSQKGLKLDNYDFWETTDGDPLRRSDIRVRSGYLELPVLAKVTIGTEKVQGFFTGGPTLGYLVSNSYTYTSRNTGKEVENSEIGDGTKRLAAGASFGVGAGYKVGTGMMNLDLRYGFDLNNIHKGGGNGLRNQAFSLSVAYLFGR